jgi:hypothetical protein
VAATAAVVTCAICGGAISAPGPVCRRCVEARGPLTTNEWLASLRATRSTILIDHRLANDLEESQRELDQRNVYRH